MFVLPNGRQRTVRFGTASNYVSNKRKTARDRAAYIARHRVNENHGDPLTPGALSRWLLWGESRSPEEPGPQHGGVQAALPVAVSPSQARAKREAAGSPLAATRTSSPSLVRDAPGLPFAPPGGGSHRLWEGLW